MNILHTSDWHLGQNFMGKTRRAEHQQFLAWLLDTAETHHVEAIIVAGDIFDSGTPPSYARELYHDFVLAALDRHISLIMLAGNHDAPASLGESQQILARLGTRVIPKATPDALDQHVYRLDSRYDTSGAIVCAVPYLRARDIMRATIAPHVGISAQLPHAIEQFYANVFKIAKQQQTEHFTATGITLPIILTGHLTVAGGESSESVRDIYIGNLKALPINAFPPADYVALGHLHRAQNLSAPMPVQYSGSPIPLSFDESRHEKNVILIKISKNGDLNIENLKVPIFQHLKNIRGTGNTLKTMLKTIAKEASDNARPWLELTLTPEDTHPDTPRELFNLARELRLEVLRITREKSNNYQSISTQNVQLDELTPTEVFQQFLQDTKIPPNTTDYDELLTRYRIILEQIAQPE